MATTRQDAWTDEEDLLLAEVVLRHIREGGTQLSAFKEVGRQLSRTPAACGFRWNSYVRKLYKEQIEEAKQIRKSAPASAEIEQKQEQQEAVTFATLDDVIFFLQDYKNTKGASEAVSWQEKLEHLQQEAEQLRQENKRLQQKLSRYEEEYRTLFDYIDRKRSVVESGEEREMQLLRERNVLEKIEK